MKKLISVIIASVMLFSLAACTGRQPETAKPTEAPEATQPAKTAQVTEQVQPTEPAEPAEPTEAPEEHEFKTGGVDFCEKLVLGETYYYDLDGDGLCDTVYYNNDPSLNADNFPWPNLKITRGCFPDSPYIFNIPTYDVDLEDGARIWVVDSDPEDGRLEIIETDDGDSADPESCILVPDWQSSGFRIIAGPGIVIDEEHPFSSEKGFAIESWTQVLGTNFVYGMMRIADSVYYTGVGFELELVSKAYYYYESYAAREFTLNKDITGSVTDEGLEPGKAITLNAGTKVRPYATDDESFLVLRLEDGRLVRVDIELYDWNEIPDELESLGGHYPLKICGEWQDELFDGIVYSG